TQRTDRAETSRELDEDDHSPKSVKAHRRVRQDADRCLGRAASSAADLRSRSAAGSVPGSAKPRTSPPSDRADVSASPDDGPSTHTRTYGITYGVVLAHSGQWGRRQRGSPESDEDHRVEHPVRGDRAGERAGGDAQDRHERAAGDK